MDHRPVANDELLSYQKDLLKEKDFLTTLLSQIDKQIHGLQVEQLQLLSTINSMENTRNTELPENKPSTSTLKLENLDLSVPVSNNNVEEEEEEDEEDKNIKLNNDVTSQLNNMHMYESRFLDYEDF